MTEHQKVLERAWQLQDRAEGEREAEVKERAMRDAASELGLDPQYLEQARAELAKEEALRQARREVARRRFGMGGLAVAGLLVAGVAAWQLTRPPPPIEEDFSGGKARWTLETNPGTQASVRFEQEAGRGEVAVIDVDRFAVAADGTFRANLDRKEGLDLEGYSTVSFSVKGQGLQKVRIYLEASGERWRSNPVDVGADWTRVTLPLVDFAHQIRDPSWKVVPWEAPDHIQKVSFKVGEFMNGPEDAGEVWIDDLVLE